MSRAARTAMEKKHPPFLFQDALLKEALFPYHLVTLQQITRLLESQEPLHIVRGYLNALYRDKLTGRISVPTRSGKRAYAYCIGSAGRTILEQETGFPGRTYLEHAELQGHSYGWIMHLLELNDFLIAAATLTRSVPSLTLVEWAHTLALANNPPSTIPQGRNVAALHPDAYLHFTQTLTIEGQDRTRHARLLVELDRGTVSESTIKGKMRNYLRLVEGEAVQQHFPASSSPGDPSSLIIVFPTTAGAQRVATLRHAAHLALTAHIRAGTPEAWINRLFHFTSLPPLLQQQPDPKTIFCTPIWTRADAERADLFPLIDLGKGAR